MSMVNFGCRIFTTGLLMVSILGVSLREAEAAFGIIVTETILMPVGDPLTQYDFKLSLAAGNQIINGDNITLMNVPNFDGNSSYVFMSGGIDYSKFFAIQATPGSMAGFSNIELVLTASPGSLINTDPLNNLPIGDLIVETNVQFPPASGSALFNPIFYTTQTHLYPSGTLNIGAGFTPTPALVPEPASLTMLGVGAVSALLMIRGRRRLNRSA